MTIRDTYEDRVVHQMISWVNGKPYHNFKDNECCADFSCCYPELFSTDLAERQARLQKLLNDYERQDNKC